MTKRIVLILMVVLALSLALTACSSDSQANATDYTKAVLKGEAEKAGKLACDSYKDATEELAARYGTMDIINIDLKFDIGKGGDEENITVTGSYMVGGEDGTEVELAESVRIKNMEEQQDTRVLVEMAKEDGDWCVKNFTDLADEMEGDVMEESAG